MKHSAAELLMDDCSFVRPDMQVKELRTPKGTETYSLCPTACRQEKEKALRKRFSHAWGRFEAPAEGYPRRSAEGRDKAVTRWSDGWGKFRPDR
jgi:hypothetical protein